MNNLTKRIITSALLLLIISISLFYNKYVWLFFIIIVSLILFIEFNNLTKKIWRKEKNTIFIVNISSFLFLALLILICYEIYIQPPIGLAFILLICVFSDTGGYIIGKLVGGKKLTKISPNKTVSGSLGSFVLSLVLVPIFNSLLDSKFLNLHDLIIIAILVSFFCQLGDLFFSYLKRKAKVKDTGYILPGHGGILDRIDGMLFAIPIGMFLWEFLIIVL